jgi:hypothetical protein
MGVMLVLMIESPTRHGAVVLAIHGEFYASFTIFSFMHGLRVPDALQPRARPAAALDILTVDASMAVQSVRRYAANFSRRKISLARASYWRASLGRSVGIQHQTHSKS